MSSASAAGRSAGTPCTSYSTSNSAHVRRPSRRQQAQTSAVLESPPRPVQVQDASTFTAVQPSTTLQKLQRARLITAIKTPYLESGKFDLAAYDRLVEHQIQNGVEGLIIGGTTGEGQLMSWDEHVMLIAHTGTPAASRTSLLSHQEAAVLISASKGRLQTPHCPSATAVPSASAVVCQSA